MARLTQSWKCCLMHFYVPYCEPILVLTFSSRLLSHQGHLDSLAAFEQRLADYNALLKRPCYFALHL